MNNNITSSPYYHYDKLYPIPMETPIFTESPYPIPTKPNLVSTLEPFNIYNIDNSISSIISSTTTAVPTKMNILYDSLLHKQIIDNTKNIENFINTVMPSSVPNEIRKLYNKLTERDQRFINSILSYLDFYYKNNFNNFIINENMNYKHEHFYRLLLEYMQSVLIDEPYYKYGDEHIFRLECIINILLKLKINIRISNISDEDMMFYFAYIDEKNNGVNNAIYNYIENVVTDPNLKNKYNSYKNIKLTFNKPNNYLLTSPPTVSVIQ